MQTPKGVLMALSRCADNESLSYALGNVRIERQDDEHAVGVVTDGRVMVAVRFPCPVTDGQTEPLDYVVPTDLITTVGRAAKTDRKKPTELSVEKTDDGRMRVSADTSYGGLAAESAEPVEGRFPKWRECWPAEQSPEAVSVAVDPRLLARVLLAVADAATDDEGCRAVTLSIDPKAKVAIQIRAARWDRDGDGITAAALVNVMIGDVVHDWQPRGEDA